MDDIRNTFDQTDCSVDNWLAITDFLFPSAHTQPAQANNPIMTNTTGMNLLWYDYPQPVKRQKPSCARIGYCQHPKHMIYRQDAMKTSAPRRGRPPKGTKPSDKRLQSHNGSVEPWVMTVRSLPRRLEAVMGQNNIRVCLTCLKRTDLDLEYLRHPAYIGPQTQKQPRSS